MPKGMNAKYKLYYLANIMCHKTDETHFLTMQEIIRALQDYEVSAERKSLYDDLRDLEKFGIEIGSEKRGRETYYHVIGRSFELAEVKLLVDSIQSSKFISANRSKQLIGKLEGFVSDHEAKSLQRQVYVQGRIKSMNTSIYNNVDVLHRAIAENKQISFQYFHWNRNKQAELRHDGRLYVVSPWGLCFDSENYYLIAYDAQAGRKKHFRVDKMKSISLLESVREGSEAFKNTDMAAYNRKNFGMFGGEETTVTLRVRNDLANVLIDRFGKDIPVIEEDDPEFFRTWVNVEVSEHFLAWVFGLGDGIVITGPEHVLEQAEKMVERLRETYINLKVQ